MPSSPHFAVSKLMPKLTDPFKMPTVLLLTNMYHPNVLPMSPHASTTVIYGFEPLDFVACAYDWSPTFCIRKGMTLTHLSNMHPH